MEETQIAIVGAGPAGLTLGLALAKRQVKCIIFEKEDGIGEDPRGVFLAHDAVRTLWNLGLSEDMPNIGHELPHVNFHVTSFATKPYYRIDLCADAANQALPNGILQIQPKLEKALRNAVQASEYCDLRCRHNVTGCQPLEDGLIVEYAHTESRTTKQIKCAWLVGADGKRGIVRKSFLEPRAGIRQIDSRYRYDGTWVAANFKIRLPTPESHPMLSLWAAGYTPEQVYDLFWPKGWHFAMPPGKATATGRFGPYEERYWRHEFGQNDWHDGMDAEALLWDHITPMLTRVTGLHGEVLPGSPVSFPRDCIDVLRCRPFRFTHKVVNRWFDHRTILIGDAAHVFPPFGGQGIASGIRDANELAWRLAVLCQSPAVDQAQSDKILNAWASERSRSILQAAAMTEMNGQLCNGMEPYSLKLLRSVEWVLKTAPFLPNPPSPINLQEQKGFKGVKDGFIAHHFSGGAKLAQIWLSEADSHPMLSDTVLCNDRSVMTLLILGSLHEFKDLTAAARLAIDTVDLPHTIISQSSMACITRQRHEPSKFDDQPDHITTRIYSLSAPGNMPQGSSTFVGNEVEFFVRLGLKTKFALVRPDMHIYGTMRTKEELQQCLLILRDQINST